MIHAALEETHEPEPVISFAGLPPLLARNSGQFALSQELGRLRRGSHEWFSLLSHRYRAGTERFIREVSRDYIDEARLELLQNVLRSELKAAHSSEDPSEGL